MREYSKRNAMRWLLGSVLPVLAAGTVLVGCPFFQTRTAAQSEDKEEMSSEEIGRYFGENVGAAVADLREKRTAALAAPGDMAAASAYGDKLYDLLMLNYAQISGVDWKQYLEDAISLLSAAAQASTAPEPAADALAHRAAFIHSLGDAPGAVAAMREAFARAHTFRTGMVRILGVEKKYAEAQTLCESTRPLAEDEAAAFELIEACLNAAEQKETNAKTLPWVSEADWKMCRRLSEERAEARLAARRAEAEADEARHQAWVEEENARQSAASTGATTESAGSAGPARVSFTLRNTCPRTVKLFYGKTPKFGSGRSSSIGGNTSQSESMNQGDMIWIVDDGGNGISNFGASPGVREVEISSACTGFTVR